MAGEREREDDVADEQDKAPYAIWQPLGAPALIGDPIVQCLILILVTSVVFLAFPGHRHLVLRSLLRSRNGFLVARLEAFTGCRDVWRDVTADIAIVLVAVAHHQARLAAPALAAWAARHRSSSCRRWPSVPGIVTNLIFKNHWGRPRPYPRHRFRRRSALRRRMEDHRLLRPNCSFISGEGSSAIWLLTLAVLLPARWRHDRHQGTARSRGGVLAEPRRSSARISCPT